MPKGIRGVSYSQQKQSEMKRIILASNSPRRQELLRGLDLNFTVEVHKGIKESFPTDLPADEVPLFIAREKAADYQVPDDAVLITADTVVIIDNEVLGKPKDAAKACHMLGRLSGRTHHVVTGVCLTTSDRQVAFSSKTNVTFRELSPAEIQYYVKTYKPFDKAGAYGIQEWIGHIGVISINGSFFNVMGLPVARVYEELKKIGAI